MRIRAFSLSKKDRRYLIIVVATALPCLMTGVCLADDQPAVNREALAATFRSQLRDELTTHWYPRMMDKAHGGFHENAARDWSPRPDDGKFLVFQARMTWTAAAYGEFDPSRREEFLGYARHGLACLDQVMRDREHGGFHWNVDVSGNVDPRLGDEKHVYGISFVIYAASCLKRVGGDDLALQVARDAFDWLEAHSHDAQYGGYFEALKRDGTPITAWEAGTPLWKRVDRLGIYYGFKTMNSHIHMLEALAELSRVDDRPIVKERLKETFLIVRDKIAIEPGALNLYLTRDWRAIPAHDSFGHDVETAYLLVEAAHALGIPDDERTWTVARSLVDHALDWGWDEKYGGFYDKGESFAGAAFDQTKVWWTQAEGLNALLVMDRKYGRETDRYLQAFQKQWTFIKDHLIDPEYSGWFAEAERDGRRRGDGAKASPWKVNYHTSRALMNAATLLSGVALNPHP